ncbi:MAG TPA: ABC transporter permease [Mycobacteriales bacterium]|nr:ABC transporter permease [Mycobacteriales bacterium]
MADSSGGLAGLRFRRLHEATRIRSAAGIPVAERLLDIWERRDVLRMLTERGLRQKYAGSVLGYAWSLIEPALLIVTYFLLLKIFHRSYPMYPLFIGSTILPWQWFSSTVNSATSSLRANSRLITSIALPREIYPLADVAEKAIEFFLSLPVLVIVAWGYGAGPSGFIFALPLVWALELMICTGFALLVSSLNTVLRDIQRGIGIVIRMLFYLVPALYPLSRLTPAFRRYDSYNPLVGVLEVNRAVWFPGYWTGWRPVYFSVIGAFVVLVLGFSVFVRVERSVLKEL